MSNDSVLYTIGTALNRAHSSGATVEVLVEGHWLAGRVAAVDGHGVVLAGEDQQSVVRMSSVSAVRTSTVAPEHSRLPAGTRSTPMPAA